MTLNDVIRKIRKESFASSLYATDGCNTVKFVTDNQNEYFAVEQYFNTIWDIWESKDFLGSELLLTRIISLKLEHYDETVSMFHFRPQNDLFYDRTSGFLYNDDLFYVVAKNPSDSITIFDKRRREVYFLRSSDKVDTIHLSQLIKDPINSQRLMQNTILLHSSSCVFEGKSFLFPAQKGAGKSTIVTSLLSYGGKYIGNDSSFVFVKGKRLFLSKNPHCLRLGLETVEHNDNLKEYLANTANISQSKMLYAELVINGKVQIVPSALKHIFGESSIAKDMCPLDYIVFPKLSVDKQYNTIRPLSREEGIEKLAGCIKDSDHKVNWLPFNEIGDLEQATNQAFHEICENLPSCYAIEYNGNPLEVYHSMENFINNERN